MTISFDFLLVENEKECYFQLHNSITLQKVKIDETVILSVGNSLRFLYTKC